MSNTIRIRTTPNGGDKYLKLKLEQDFDFIEILSLKITQEDAYRKFCSDYGVIVGRVTINNGFGVPNAKVSVFIPIDEIDKEDTLIKGLYPYETVTDKDSDGIRYNLLPIKNVTSNDCYTPVGTFHTKRAVLDNEVLSNIYCKYYKFTTTTNHAGDFMIFGVPVGTHTVHVDADISDIGPASQRPYDLISQGAPAKTFESTTKFKSDKNLNKLSQIKTLNSGVNVEPFWGDTENCEVGINRLDFDLNHTITPSAIFMGSIFGDQDKHSINKNCRPRKKLGSLCEQVSGTGDIKMIRKTIDGDIENFDVEGGRVIDENGNWAYQIPMNLDYVVTDEDGNLIPSQDPNVGIPTKASVRFNIGMDENGGEGRVRTRARFLIPNNPSNANEDDYEFGPNTKHTSFRDLYWNKIYTVSNFITRFQTNNFINKVKTRKITGIKEVDECGDKTPFPYNRVKTESSPLFFVLCLIIKIVALIVATINGIIIPIINTILFVIYKIINAIISLVSGILSAIDKVLSFLGINNNLGSAVSPIAEVYVPCIAIPCDGKFYAPGCNGNTKGWVEANKNPNTSPVSFYVGDSHGNTGLLSSVGFDDCIAFQLADALNLFQFDFYNDWVNGSLYAFLLKYKHKRKGKEKFCEYDCDDFGISAGGVDGNNDGTPDNRCNKNVLVDTCFDRTSPNSNLHKDGQEVSYDSGTIKDGLIKKVGDEFFYAATTHFTPSTGFNYKLFATEIVSLGPILDCDWQGIPKINDSLTPTSYKLPPDTFDIDDGNPTATTFNVLESGMVQTGKNNPDWLFFTVNCGGLHTDYHGCLNIRHICEMGVDIDAQTEIGNILIAPDGTIGSNDISDVNFRDVFYALNSSPTPWIGVTNFLPPPNGFSTSFNTKVIGAGGPNPTIYDFTSSVDNGSDYIKFRNYSNSQNGFGDTSHSYFFYFGLTGGKTALDKMNDKFNNKCLISNRNNYLIQSTSTVASPNTPNGSITFKFIGGTGPFTYTVIGLPPLSFTTVTGTVNGSTNVVLSGLRSGSYIINGLDTYGTPISRTVVVPSPQALNATVNVTKHATTATSSDGEITISYVGGGVAPYTYELKSFAGAILIPAGTPLIAPLIIPYGLMIDKIQGYVVNISDTLSTISIGGLLVNGVGVLTAVLTSKVDVTCFGDSNGEIHLNIIGGQSPYLTSTTGPNGYSSPSTTMVALIPGSYVTNVVDDLGVTTSITTNIISLNPQMVIQKASPSELSLQLPFSSFYILPFYITAGVANNSTANVQHQLDNNGTWIDTQISFTNSTSPVYIINIPKSQLLNNIEIRIKDSTGTCFSNSITVNKSEL